MTRLWHGRRPGFRAFYQESGGIYTPPAGGGTMSISGLGTFTRSGSATWWDGTTLTSYSTNVLREPETDWLALEGSSTNYMEQTESISNWSTLTNVTVTDNSGTDPYGNATAASLIQHSGSNSFMTMNWGGDPGGNGWSVASGFFKGVTGTEDTNHRPYWQGDTTTDTLNLTSSWARYDTTLNVTSSSGIDRLIIKDDAADNDEYYYFGAQYELSGQAFPTSYIPNDAGTASVTRSADDLRISSASIESWLLDDEWTVEVRPSFSSSDFINQGDSMTLIGFDGGTAYLRLILDGGACKVRLTDGTTTATTGAITFARDQSMDITCNMSTGVITIADASSGNGDSSAAGAITWPTSTDLRVGADYAGTNPYFGLIHDTIQQA